MAHRHSVYDTDLHFTIDPISRRISSTSGKVTLMQNDHNSERFTFEIARYVEGHDMTLCNVVEVHYTNIDAANKRNRSEDVYPVIDLQLCPDDENVVILSWLISEHATKYAGTLNFIIRFACISEDEERLVEYQWWTDIYKLIAIGEGMTNTDIVTDGDDSDVLARWKDEVMALAQPYVDAAANSAVNAAESETNAKTSELNAATSEVNAKNSELKAARSEENAKTSETRANAYSSNAKASEVNAAKSEANAKASKEYAAAAVTAINNINDEVLETLQTVSDSVDEYTARLGNTTFTVNLETGELEYESPDYIFYVNEETGNLEWETLREGSRSGEEMIHQLDSEKTDAIVLTTAGTYCVMEDSSDDPLRGLKLFGRTEQFTTTGAQLYDTTKVTSTTDKFVCTMNDDYSFTINGSTNIDNHIIYKQYLNLEPGTYYISGGGIGEGTIRFQLRKTLADDTLEYKRNSSFTIDGTEKEVYVNIQVDSPGSITDYTLYPMLNKGSTPLPYEPYTGGIPSPNPKYPQDLVSAGDDGDIEVPVYDGDLSAGNLCDNEWVQGSINNMTGEDFPSGTEISTKNFIRIIPNTEYNLRRSLTGGFNKLRFYDKNYQFIGQGSEEMLEVIKGGSASNILRSEAIHAIMRVINEDVAYMRIVETTNDLAMKYFVGVYDGTVNDPYLELQSITALTPNGLPGIKVIDATLANYTDSDGNMWCCDEIDFERGVYVKRVGEAVFDGSDDESWAIRVSDYTGNSGNQLRFSSDITGKKYGRYANCMSNVGYVGIVGSVGVYSPPGIVCYYSTSKPYEDIIYLTLEEEKVTSLSTFKSWLSDNPISVIYMLEDPIETPLSDEEMTQYRALHSNYPVTTVINDAGVHMELKYNADTKNYIAAEHVKMENMFNAKLEELKALMSAQT